MKYHDDYCNCGACTAKRHPWAADGPVDWRALARQCQRARLSFSDAVVALEQAWSDVETTTKGGKR